MVVLVVMFTVAAIIVSPTYLKWVRNNLGPPEINIRGIDRAHRASFCARGKGGEVGIIEIIIFYIS